MVGCDWHAALLAALPPIPVPLMPHAVIMPVRGYTFSPEGNQEEFTKNVLSDGGLNIAQRGYDIGMFILHISIPPLPFNTLTPLIMLGSGSICEWGGFTVEIEGKPPALGFPLYIGAVNLNCADPVSGTSLNLQSSVSTVVVGFTFGDFLGSAFAIGFDIGITSALKFLGKGAMKGLGKLGSKYFGKALQNNAFIKTASNKFSQISGKASEKLVTTIGEEGAEELMDSASDQFVDQVIIGGGPGQDAPFAIANALDLNSNLRDHGAASIADYFNGVDRVQ